MPFSNHVLRGFGGLNENEDPTALRPTDLRLATNVARLGELTGTRPGLIYDVTGEYAAAIATAPVVQGIHEWTRNQDATRELISVAGGNVYKDNTSGALDKATNSVTISSGANYHWTFADHNNVLYAAGGNVGDSFWFWDGAGSPGTLDKVDVQNSAAQTLRPKFVFQWKNYLLLTGMNRALPDDNPLVWRYHDLGSDPTAVTSWPAGNTIGGSGIGGLPGYGSEFATGTASFQDNNGDFLLLLTNKRIYSYILDPFSLVGFRLNDAIANGCVSQRAFVDLGMDSGDAIYVSNVGIHSLRLSQQYSGRARSFLSWPIRQTFASLNRSRMSQIAAGYWPTEGIVAFAVSTGSSTTHDLILAMDIQGAQEITPDTVRWYKWRLTGGLVPNQLTFARDSSNQPSLYVGGTGGEVVKFARTAYSDLGSAYGVQFRTKDEDFGAPGVQKTMGDCHLIMRGSGPYKPMHTYIFDYGKRTGPSHSIETPNAGSVWDTMVWDTDVWSSEAGIFREYLYGHGSCEAVAHDFSHGGANQPFFVASISQQVAGAGEAFGEEEAA